MESSDVESLFPDMPDLDDLGGEQDQLDLVESSREKVKQGFALLAKEDWVEEKITDDASLWSRAIEGESIKHYKREMTVNASLEKVVNFFKDVSNLKGTSDAIADANTFLEVNDDAWFNYSEYHGNLFISNRDAVQFGYKMNLSDGSVVLISQTTDHPDKPERDGVVRSEVVINCFHFTKVSENKTKILNVCKSDLKGSIPVTFVNWLCGVMHDEWVAIKKLVEA